MEIFFGYLGAYSTKKRNIFIFYVLGTIFSILMFWSVGSYAAILPVLTTGIRYFIFIFKDKYKTELPLIFCLIMHFIVLFISAKTPIDIVPSALVIIGCLIYWYLDKEKLKMAIFLINIPWILYYFYCGLYLTTINAIIQTILVGIAYLNLRRISKMDKLSLSLNNKFFRIKPNELLHLIQKYDKSKLIYGFEIATENKNDEEYVKEFTKLICKKGYKINLHSLPFKDQTDIENYLSFAVELSKITNDKINIVYHPVESSNYKDSIDKTKDTIKLVFKCIEDNNYSKYIDISIENLNKLGNIVRLKKEDLIEILNMEPKLKFTYDIGHETIDNIVTNELPQILEERLNNIHIHSHKENRDHYPIEKLGNEKVLSNLLIKYGKKQNVVMEYALDYIEGENFEKKLENYINYAKIIKY
ncbi:MAG: YgjV family protein [Clostridia bacterium]|nr:YgjV family protein [Clostridia bacterium]